MAFLRYLRALVLSFYSRRFYRSVLLDWRGSGILFLLFLSVLAEIPIAAKITLEQYEWSAGERAAAFFRQVPEMRIRNGELQTDAPTPHAIRDLETGKLLMVVDPKDSITADELPEGVAVLGKRGVLIHSRGQLRQIFYKGWADVDIDRDKAQQWSKVITLAGIPLVFLAVTLVYFLVRVLVCIAVAGASARYANRISANLGFAERMRICAVAFTPAVLLGTAVDLSPVPIPFFSIIRLIVIGFYALYALRANIPAPLTVSAGQHSAL
jgi:hypothetical protein